MYSEFLPRIWAGDILSNGFKYNDSIMSKFKDKLINSCKSSNSFVCVGLDPDPSKIPSGSVLDFCKDIVDSTSDVVAAYKPNLAFFEALGLEGLTSLKNLVDYIHKEYPEKLTIGDAKRGDIGSSSAKYASALFEYWGFDSVTVNAFAGKDSIDPFLQYKDKGVFIWCKSSNADGPQIQGEFDTKSQNSALFERIAIFASEWNKNENIGLVVGATYPKDIYRVRKLSPGLPILIPGVGSQEGSLSESVSAASELSFPNFLINSSRSIIYSSNPFQSSDILRKSINESLS